MVTKKKTNERRNYNLGKNDVVPYRKASIQRKMNFLILRGAGLDAKEVIEENQVINAFCTKQSVKSKYLQARNEEDVIKFLKDANTWATAVIFNPGELDPNTAEIQKTIKKLLIPVKKLAPETDVSAEAYLMGMKEIMAQQRPAKA